MGLDIKPSWTVHLYLAVRKIIPGLSPQLTAEDQWSPFPGKNVKHRCTELDY